MADDLTAAPWPAHSPERRYFSVLCYRGWCDPEFKNRDIAAMVETVTGVKGPLPKLAPRECPMPAECQCECHDGEDDNHA